MAKIWCSQTVRQIDRQIDIKIGYPETNRLNGIDMVLSDRQIDRQIYQNQISRDKQIECHRYGSQTVRQIDRQIDIKIGYPETNRLNGIDMVLSDRQIDRQIDIKIRYPETNRQNGKDMVFSDSQIDRQIDRYQNWISRDIRIEGHRYGTLRQIDRQIDRYIKIRYPETNRLNGKDMVFSDSQIDRQIDRQIENQDIQRQTD